MLNSIKIKQKFLLIFSILSILNGHAQTGLVVTELMVHPLNNAVFTNEYIELYNNGTQVIALEDYTLQVANNSIRLGNYYLAPRQYILLVAASVAPHFERYGNVMPIQTWRILNNINGTVTLLDKEQMIVDQVSYSNNWYGNPQKRNGGWSLERINPNLPCNNGNTWRASEAANGGTPAQQNSIWEERYAPAIRLTVQEINDESIVFRVFPSITDVSFGQHSEITVEIDDLSIARYELGTESLTLYTSAALTWDTPINIHFRDIRYCGQAQTVSVSLFRSSLSAYNDLVINEVLFNPKVNGVDFVELYNRSNKTINLRGWRIGNRVISTEDLLMEPNDYRVLSSSPQRVQEDYPNAVSENFIAMQSLPAYPNERGIVLLYDQQRLIDSLFYQSSMHQPFLADVKGISLERQSSEEDTNSKGNFSSASTLVGGATPGYRNSTDVEKKVKKNSWWLDRKTFTPSGSGSESILVFNYAFSERNPMLNLTIYDSNGRVVNRLIRNKSAGLAGEVIWDGRNEQGVLCPSGIYIYQSEIHTSEGHYQQFKGSFVLIDAGK